jgi:hypothetical protein
MYACGFHCNTNTFSICLSFIATNVMVYRCQTYTSVPDGRVIKQIGGPKKKCLCKVPLHDPLGRQLGMTVLFKPAGSCNHGEIFVI